jgi:hypothetical protein
LFAKGGARSKKGLYFTQVSIFGDSCQGGESISPKQRDRTTHQFIFKNIVLRKDFSNGDFSIWYLIFDRISNWYNPFKTNI